MYLLAVATPGPAVAAVLARSLTHGMRGAPAFIAGFLIGDLIWFAGASAGLAALAQSAQTVFLVVRYAGAVYLLYLAYRLWTAPARPLGLATHATGGFHLVELTLEILRIKILEIVIVFILFGLLIVFSQSSAVAPFIYTLF